LTPTPGSIYLPILLRESCTPAQQSTDVALVVDASTSMLDPTAAGRPKLDAAIDAAGTFLDQLKLDAGDQAAIVSFNADATLRAELTDDRASLDAALASIAPASQTCLVCGVDAGADELASSRRRADNTPLLIVLTDGLSNPRPASEAVERAAEAKAAGVVIHTIGLGDTLDFDALEAMASEPDDFHRAPDGEDLAAIYEQIAVEIPCPPSRWWGRR
jgi:Mg-chelatase subunit ChlD